MKKVSVKPDAESHLHVNILNRNVDINFRYFSPPKSATSE